MASEYKLVIQGASGNCDINKSGDVLTQHEVIQIVQNPDQSFAFKAFEHLNPNQQP